MRQEQSCRACLDGERFLAGQTGDFAQLLDIDLFAFAHAEEQQVLEIAFREDDQRMLLAPLTGKVFVPEEQFDLTDQQPIQRAQVVISVFVFKDRHAEQVGSQ